MLVPRSTQIKTYSWDNAQVLLVGNKCDMEDERVVSGERGRQLSEHLGEHTDIVQTLDICDSATVEPVLCLHCHLSNTNLFDRVSHPFLLQALSSSRPVPRTTSM